MPTTSMVAETVTARDLDIFSHLYTHELLNLTQLGALYSTSAVHQRTLERRLRKLVAGGYVAELDTPRGVDPDYMLNQRGMDELTKYNRDRFRKRDLPQPQRSEILRPHDLATSDFTLSHELTARDYYEGATIIPERSILERAKNRLILARRGWQVDINHPTYGEKKGHWMQPDAFQGFQFLTRPIGGNERYYITEIDRGTMPLRGSLKDATIRRKLLAIEATVASGVLREKFDVDFAYFLFVAPGYRRCRNIAEEANTVLTDIDARMAVRFTVQPSRPTFDDYRDVTKLKWIDCDGNQSMLPM